MATTNEPGAGGIRLFRLFGIDVYLHWLWIVVAIYEINTRQGTYTSPIWNVAEYISLFVVVLLHEFGHALACKSVGGEAKRILLWPLGGVAFVSPPQRPGAVLWSIAAGPLVNVLLAPAFFAAYAATQSGALPASENLQHFTFALLVIDILLFAFNMLPIYPLDGGQILRALLWFVIGPATSLTIASMIGLFGAAAAMIWALSVQEIWFIILAAFGLMWSWSGLQQANRLKQLRALPRTHPVACPSCGEAPPAVEFWQCIACGQPFDPFLTRGQCPNCGQLADFVTCAFCGKGTPFNEWRGVESMSSPAATAPVNTAFVMPPTQPPLRW